MADISTSIKYTHKQKTKTKKYTNVVVMFVLK